MPEQTPAKKKVYVETTVVSDVVAFPTNDLAVAGRQAATPALRRCFKKGGEDEHGAR